MPEMCNGDTYCITDEWTLEPWIHYCEDCDAQRLWVEMPKPHEKDKDYND